MLYKQQLPQNLFELKQIDPPGSWRFLLARLLDSQPRDSWTLTHHVLGGRVLDHVGAGHLKEQPLGYEGVPGLLPEILQLPCQELTAPLPIRWGTPFCMSTGWAWGQVPHKLHALTSFILPTNDKGFIPI